MDAKLYDPMLEFCLKAGREVEKRIARCKVKGRVIPDQLLQYRKLFNTEKWTMKMDTLLYRLFIGKDFDDSQENFFLYTGEDKITSISILHLLNSKVLACECAFSLNLFGFKNLFSLHEDLLRSRKAKILIYPFKSSSPFIDKYLLRKAVSKSLKRLKNIINLKVNILTFII